MISKKLNTRKSKKNIKNTNKKNKIRKTIKKRKTKINTKIYHPIKSKKRLDELFKKDNNKKYNISLGRLDTSMSINTLGNH